MAKQRGIQTHEQYLATVDGDKRPALERVRKAVRSAAPGAEECINYGVPAFRLEEKCIAGFSASAAHLSYYPMSGATIAAHKEELKGFETSKGAITFGLERPLPTSLVKKLVKWRMEEIAAATAGKAKRIGKRGAAGMASESPKVRGARADAGVEAFLKNHPLKKEIGAVRKIIRGVSPEIGEGIKWNAPSFRASDYFATVNVRDRSGTRPEVWLILHTGAKGKKPVKVADPDGILKWLAKDRALVRFADEKDVRAKKGALEGVVREWIGQL